MPSPVPLSEKSVVDQKNNAHVIVVSYVSFGA